jgi:hypothetical protein
LESGRFHVLRIPGRGYFVKYIVTSSSNCRVGDNPGGTPERERAAHENHEYEVSLRQ